MELQQLRLFIAAAESESFTRGAERAFVSQPALSASISKLEAELGTQLFIRNKRNVVLTPAGRKLIKRARLIVSECAQAKGELKQHETQRSLRLGVINTLSITRVATLIEQYRREQPGLKLEVVDATAADLALLEREGRIDLALTLIPERSKQGEPLTSMELFTEPYVVILPKNHHLSHSPAISVKELHDEPFIARSHCEHRRIVQDLLKQHDVKLDLTYITNQDDRALALVEAEVGIAIVPEHYSSSRLVQRPLAEGAFHRTIGFRWVMNGANQEEVEAFTKFAKAAPW